MALGFFLGIFDGKAQIVGPDNKVFELPAQRVPKDLKPGTDFNYRSSKRGFIHITPPADTTSRKPTNSAQARQQYGVNRLMSKGWSREQASGVIGRFMQESFADLRTNAVGDREIPGGSFGIGQWNRGRKQALESFARKRNTDPGNFDTQLDFFDWEIRNSPSERKAFIALKAAKSPEDAGLAMMHYERPEGYSPGNPAGGHGWRNTAKNAFRVFKTMAPAGLGELGEAAATATGAFRKARTAGAGSEDILGFGGLEDDFADDEIDTDIPEEEQEEQFGEDLVAATEGLGQTGTVDTSASREAIMQMFLQGQQAQQVGPLARRFEELVQTGA